MWLQAAQTRRIQKDSEKRKERNRVAHSAPGSIKVKPARRKKVVAELE
jgi:DDB1- and CUL4-associated factor 13